MRYRKKPIEVNALQFTGTTENIKQMKEFTKMVKCGISSNNDFLLIHTLEGVMRADLNDFIIQGVVDEFYPCKPDIFEKTYERI